MIDNLTPDEQARVDAIADLKVRARRRLEVRAAVTSCSACPLRDHVRPHPVPFDGPLRPAFVVLGEAPDQADHRHLTPFSGVHGRTLQRLLVGAGVNLSEGLFLNVVSCDPWGSPDRSCIDACRPNRDAQLELADRDTPLLAVGQTALSSLIPDGTIRGLQGSALIVDGRPVMPIYHPAYLLRDPTARPGVKEALTRFRSLLSGLPPTFFLATVCSICAGRAETWDDRQVPYCGKHEVEIQRNVRRAERRRRAENRAAQGQMEL